jgi:hypothetical protein
MPFDKDILFHLILRDGIEPGILWIAEQVKQNLDRPPRQKDIT